MYSAVGSTHLDYRDVIYHIPPKVHPPSLGMSLNDHMEMITVTGTWQGTSRVKNYEKLGWESLSDRRISRRVLQMQKIIDEKTHEYLRDCLPPNRKIGLNLPSFSKNLKQVLIVMLVVFSLMPSLFGIISYHFFWTSQPF